MRVKLNQGDSFITYAQLNFAAETERKYSTSNKSVFDISRVVCKKDNL